VKLSPRRLLLLLDNLLISETEPSYLIVAFLELLENVTAAFQRMPSLFRLRFAYKKEALQNQAASLEVCSAPLYKSLLQTKKPRTKHPKLSYDCKTELA